MENEDKIFHETRKNLISFKEELKTLILKYKITVRTQCDYVTPQDDCDGVGTDVDYIYLDGVQWHIDDLYEIIKECFNFD